MYGICSFGVRFLAVLIAAGALAGCGDDGATGPDDAGMDRGSDSGDMDAGSDGTDDAGSGSMDGGDDAGNGGAPDAGFDGGTTPDELTLSWTEAVPDAFRATAVATDGSGNAYVGLEFSGTVELGASSLSASGDDGALAKYNSEGNVVWARLLGGNGVDRIEAVAVDPGQRVCAAGWFRDTIMLAGEEKTAAGSGAAGDMFLACFPLDGRGGQGVNFGSSSGVEAITDLTFGPEGNIYATGQLTGSVDFGSGSCLGASGSGSDVFTAQFDSDLQLSLCKRHGNDELQKGSSIAVDEEGNVYVAGYFQGNLNLGRDSDLTGDSSNDVFVVNFSGLSVGGETRWQQRIGGSENEADPALAKSGNRVWVAGSFDSDSITVGGGALASSGAGEMYLAGYDADTGDNVWAKHFGSDASSDFGKPRDIAVDGDGNAHVVGRYFGETDFGGGVLTATGSRDAFWASFRPDGSHRLSRGMHGSEEDTAYGVAVGPEGEVFVAGQFRSDLQLEGASLTANNIDLFLLKYAF